MPCCVNGRAHGSRGGRPGRAAINSLEDFRLCMGDRSEERTEERCHAIAVPSVAAALFHACDAMDDLILLISFSLHLSISFLGHNVVSVSIRQ